MKILFMGTPDFAAVSLRVIAAAGENIVGVLTAEDKPRGRGYELTPSPVKIAATELGIPVYQPRTLRSPEFYELLSQIAPELIVVVAYGKILPQNVLDFPVYGSINAHASILPRYRGAAPIQRAIMAGENETGVTAMYMDAGVDTGDMILMRSVTIEDDDDFGTVHDKLAAAGAEALLETIKRIGDGTVTREAQDSSQATYAAKIENDDMTLDFSCDAVSLYNRIRALSPYPTAFTHTPDGKILKIIASAVVDAGDNINSDMKSMKPGTVTSTDGGMITVMCGTGLLAIKVCQPEGKRRMSAADFINGRKIAVGDILF